MSWKRRVKGTEKQIGKAFKSSNGGFDLGIGKDGKSEIEIDKEEIESAIIRMKERDSTEFVLSGIEGGIKKYGLQKVFATVGDLRSGLRDDKIDALVKEYHPTVKVKIK